MGLLGDILERREEQQVCIKEDCNASPYTNRFIAIDKLFIEHNVCFYGHQAAAT